MKSFAGILFALLIGVAVAFIRPAEPFQVENPAGPAFGASASDDGLDNAAIQADGSIHPARKVR